MKRVRDEGLFRPERFSRKPEITENFLKDELGFILKKIDENLSVFIEKFPAPASVNNIYPSIGNTDWTSCFWTGMLWLAYEVTGEEKYRTVAELQIASYKERLEKAIEINTHDLGFLYSLSCIAGYKLTGNLMARDTALKAAELLMERYYEKAGIIQAWGDLSDVTQRGRMIIDGCMNLPLLFWAAGQTGKSCYYEAAHSHARQAARYIVREDASTFHTFYMDADSGEPKYGKTHQGFSDNSCWARGQAWGIYGFPLSYLFTGDWEMIELSKKLANYFLNRLPEDEVCYWDLLFTEGEEERDSSAAAIAVCGFLEMSRHLPLSDKNKSLYENAALKIFKTLAENYTSGKIDGCNGILCHAVYSKPSGLGVDECCIWGDYYYFEALVRIMKDWKPYC